ncbi:Ig-like domain-containing protein [Ideonella sp. A 288]|uniref:Ig-like domain-containing protein n=1 Tax=Ideonella sp. A 288 TaxID=1962181 RepID=UPI000B4AF935|nr:Ig-like domain-containing protein [Ideonella sp. A 288]
MPTFIGSDTRDDRASVIGPGNFLVDGKGGTDTVDFGTSQRSSYTIVRRSDGVVMVDTLSGASQTMHSELTSIERLSFNSGRDVIDLATFFGDIAAPTVAISDNVAGTATGRITYTLAFSEPVGAPGVDDFIVTGGSVVSIGGRAAVYEVVVEPNAGTAGTVGLTLKAAAVTDAAGNPNAEAVAAPQAFDTRHTTVAGTAGNDRLIAGTGLQTVDGAGGIDTLVLPHGREAYTVALGAHGTTVTANDGSATLQLTGVERLEFAHSKLALDLDGHAGTVAKVLGAVFGRESVHNTDYVGIGLGFSDGGMGYQALMQLALDARLGANANHGAVVDLLFTNVVGVAPTAEQRASFVALLDSGAHTHGSLGVLAADHPLNLANIELAGLAQTGLLYVGG